MSGAWERANAIDILLATPISAAELVYYEWSETMLNNWLALPKDYKVARVKFPEPVIDITRDKAVQIAIQNGTKWLWFVDADILPPRDALIKLIEANKPIVGGLYVRRHNPPFNEMLRFRTDGLPGLKPIQDGEFTPGELVECDAVATGCLLIQMEVFEKMKPHQLAIDGQQARPAWFLWTEWRLPNGLSEDFEFATWAKKQGIPVYCHTGVQCRHIGPIKFLPGGKGGINLEFPGGQQ